MTRVQAPELRADIKLQPAPIQSDTYAPPPRVAQDNRYAALADALSSFSGSIGRVAASGAFEPTEEQKQQEAYAAEMKLANLPRDQLAAMVASGEATGFAPELAARGINSVGGNALGSKFVEDVRNHLTTEFDWDTGDADKYITDKAGEFLQTPAGQDPVFGAAFYRHVQSARGWSQEYAAKRTVDQFTEAKGAAAFTALNQVVLDGERAGLDHVQIADNLFKAAVEVGPTGVLSVSDKDVDREMASTARRIATTNPELALEIFNRERKGRDGVMRSLSGTSEYRDIALNVAEGASRVQAERAVKEWTQEVNIQNLALTESGDMDQIRDTSFTDANGKVTNVTVAQQKEAASAAYLAKSTQIAVQNREAPNERLTRELRAFRQSGEQHPQLKSELTGMASMAAADLSGDPEGAQKLIGKLETYRWLRDESPASLLAHTTSEDRDFAETYTIAQDELGLDPQEALSASTRAIKVSKDGVGGLSREDRDALSRGADNAANVTWGRDGSPANLSDVEDRIYKTAMVYKRLGMATDKAITTATESVKKTTVVYNGVVVNASKNHLPSNFNEGVDDAIADFAKVAPNVLDRNDLDISDISIGEFSGGRWALIDKTTMLPLKDDEGNIATISVGGIVKQSNKKAAAKAISTQREMTTKSTAKQRGLVPRGDSWLDPKTGEVYTPGFTGDGLSPTWKKTGKRMPLSPFSGPSGDANR